MMYQKSSSEGRDEGQTSVRGTIVSFTQVLSRSTLSITEAGKNPE